MVFRPVAILVPPLIAGTIQIFDRRRIRVAGIEVANGIGIHLGYASVPEALGGVKHRGAYRNEEAIVSNDRLPLV